MLQSSELMTTYNKHFMSFVWVSWEEGMFPEHISSRSDAAGKAGKTVLRL